MAAEQDSSSTEKLDDKVAAKLDNIIDGINTLKNAGIDWKSVFISWATIAVLFLGLYYFKLKDLATTEYVDGEIQRIYLSNYKVREKFEKRIYELEQDVKKLKERRIGQMGAVGDKGP